MDDAQKRFHSIPCYSKIEPIKPMNDEFTLCKVYVASTGCNRNYSYISRDTMDAAMPTLAYIPVVGHLMNKYDDDGKIVGKYFGGHDYVIDENWNFVAQTVPFGVVMADTYEYETVTEYGTELEYLTAQAVLWTGRYPDMKEAIYSEDTWFGQSMEIVVGQDRPYANDSNYREILEYNYSALCILGKSDNPDFHTEPCFISSKFVPLSYSLERDQFNKDMCEMRERLAFMLSPEEGGKTPMDMEMITSILAEYGLTVEGIDFEYAEMDEEALRAAAQEYVNVHNADGSDTGSGSDPVDDGASFEGDGAGSEPSAAEPSAGDGDDNAEFVCEFAATYNQRRDALQNALDDDVVRNASGEIIACTHYWVHDFDDQYVYVNRYSWRADGDSNDDHGRFGYSFNDADLTATLSGSFEPMYLMWLTADEKQKLDNSRNAFEELVQYKEENEKAKRRITVDELFAQFEDLQQVEGFDSLRDAAYESGEMEDVETKLFAMRGRMAKTFSKNPVKGVVKVGISHSVGSDVDDRPYGGLLKKH